MVDHGRELEKVRELVGREFSTGLMSNTKWRKMIAALDGADLGLHQMLIKFVDVEDVRTLKFPPSLQLPWPWFDTIEFGPVEFLAIEWLEFPAVSTTPRPNNVPPKRIVQDIEGAVKVISGLGQYPIEVTDHGLRVVGWVR